MKSRPCEKLAQGLGRSLERGVRSLQRYGTRGLQQTANQRQERRSAHEYTVAERPAVRLACARTWKAECPVQGVALRPTSKYHVGLRSGHRRGGWPHIPWRHEKHQHPSTHRIPHFPRSASGDVQRRSTGTPEIASLDAGLALDQRPAVALCHGTACRFRGAWPAAHGAASQQAHGAG